MTLVFEVLDATAVKIKDVDQVLARNLRVESVFTGSRYEW